LPQESIPTKSPAPALEASPDPALPEKSSALLESSTRLADTSTPLYSLKTANQNGTLLFPGSLTRIVSEPLPVIGTEKMAAVVQC